MKLTKPKPLSKCKTIVDYAYRQRYKYLMYQEAFRIHFKKPLEDFWSNNLTGFDIVEFDRWLNPEQEDISCADAVEQKYGKDAVELINKLIGEPAE